MSAAFIACNSHRARDWVLRQLGPRQSYWHTHVRNHGIYSVTAVELAQLRTARYPYGKAAFRVLRQPAHEFGKCWG